MHPKWLVLVFCFFSLLPFISVGQGSSNEWQRNPQINLGFTENLNRYEPTLNREVLFYADLIPYRILFTKDALIFTQPTFNTGFNSESAVEKNAVERSYFLIEFETVNNAVEIVPAEALKHTRNFTLEENLMQTRKARSFKKLVYHTIYPGVNLLFELPEKGGLKYTFEVQPGSNYKDIKMRYSNSNAVKDKNGNLSISHGRHTFLDHAPISFVAGKKIKSAFNCDGNIISFEIAAYDTTQQLIIDPWLVIDYAETIEVMEIANDYHHNCAIAVKGIEFGEIFYYDSNGNLKWTWAFEGADSTYFKIIADICMNPYNSDTYVTIPIRSALMKLDSTGLLTDTHDLFSYAFPDQGMDEVWRIRYDTVYNRLVTGDGGLGEENPNLTTLSADFTTIAFHQPLMSFGVEEEMEDCALLAVDPYDGAIYFMPSGLRKEDNEDTIAPYSNMLLKVDALNPELILWSKPTCMDFEEGTNLSYTFGANNGVNGITCGNNYLYLYNGQTLLQLDKFTGEEIRKTEIADNKHGQYGIDIGWCNSEVILVGMEDAVWILNENLEVLEKIETPNTCRDLSITNNSLYVCGDGFVMKKGSICDLLQGFIIPPNIFTPNGDGVNDLFTFENKTFNIAEFTCTIVNRWGVEVAHLNHITDYWDGKDLEGSTCVEGVYFYSYEAIDGSGMSFAGQGTVQLVGK